MKYIIFLILLITSGCSFGIDPNDSTITMPISYIELEYKYPQDTTWWYFGPSGTCYAAYKRKITGVSGAPAWVPWVLGYDKDGNPVYRERSSGPYKGQVVGMDNRTHQEYLDYWATQTKGWLPIEYYAGTWGEKDGMLLTLAVNRVVPSRYNGVACNMSDPVFVESLWSPMYIAYDLWDNDSLHGYQALEDGTIRTNLQHSDPDVKFSRWNGKSLADKSNPIFRQL